MTSEEVPYKTCRVCLEIKPETDFRTYGKGRRGICAKCEKETANSSETVVIENELEVAPSYGFSISKDGDSICLNQNRMDDSDKEFYTYTVILSKNELLDLIGWAQKNIFGPS